jgi:hypothetical protein
MRKQLTKIICVTTAAISALSAGLLSACGNFKSDGVSVKDTTLNAVTSNGGFLVQTGDYVYFINGITDNSGDNTYGSVVKGSIQRISKTNLKNHNYTSTDTIVPELAYSTYYDAGIYIYDDYIYYATPSTGKNSEGVVQSQRLEFKRAKADGTEAMNGYFYQASSPALEYRYVKTSSSSPVYLMYAISEDLYGTTTTNLHSVNTETGTDTLLAYNVDSYVFDSENAETPYVYYTMSVTNNLGTDNSTQEGYNQIYRVKADATTSPREYDFSNVEDYDADEDPLYVNLGEFVLDGIGIIENNTEHRVNQFNYNYNSTKQYNITHHDYTYTLSSYKDGVVAIERAESVGTDTLTRVYSVKDSDITSSWDAIDGNDSLSLLLNSSDSTEYTYLTINGKEMALYAGSNGLMLGEHKNGEIVDTYSVTNTGAPTLLAVREETTTAEGDVTTTETHLYAYFSITGGNGYTFHRVAIDGASTDYAAQRYPDSDVYKYQDVQILDIDAATDWYAPEFVDNQIIFASETYGMTAYNYIMACDLTSDVPTGGLYYIMSNEQLYEYKEQYDGIMDKIDAYDDETNSDGTQAYENLSNALNYLYYTGDSGYLADLIQAYVDVEGKSEEYLYSADSVAIFNDFASASNDWAEYAEESKQINGETVYSNSQKYYFSVIGQVEEDDIENIKDTYKSNTSMPSYPVSTITWWEGLNTVAKVFFIIGMVAAGLLVIAGITVLVIFLIKKFGNKEQRIYKQSTVDITDDKDIDVYSGDEGDKVRVDDVSSGQNDNN